MKQTEYTELWDFNEGTVNQYLQAGWQILNIIVVRKDGNDNVVHCFVKYE